MRIPFQITAACCAALLYGCTSANNCNAPSDGEPEAAAAAPKKSEVPAVDKVDGQKSAELKAAAAAPPAGEAVFAPTFKSDSMDAYPDAPEIYDSSPRARQGVYRHSGLIFVVVVIDTNREQLEYLEGTAMLRAAALLREEFPGLPQRFRARNRLLEKELDDDTGIYRYAQVFRESDILKIVNRH